eukprot:TRINITY_DN76503_c0_g1_i1.p1 TRINITY_DN76503_c0_g1~~TRINITY_DN76503_c0_g1_i1.p1  ORF type:complete len:105 (+),score=10.18 TRINITY_DN76503_c0_g1_i1:81-395(+)
MWYIGGRPVSLLLTSAVLHALVGETVASCVRSCCYNLKTCSVSMTEECYGSCPSTAEVTSNKTLFDLNCTTADCEFPDETSSVVDPGAFFGTFAASCIFAMQYM